MCNRHNGYRKKQETWHSNGSKQLLENYKDEGNKRTVKRWNIDGKLLEKGQQERIVQKHSDKLIKAGKWTYYQNGKKVRVETYENGQVVNERVYK